MSDYEFFELVETVGAVSALQILVDGADLNYPFYYDDMDEVPVCGDDEWTSR